MFDPAFVKRLCNGKCPSLGLHLFSNPAWTRGYLTRRTQAWNASGGASDSGWVEFDEEVLILYARVPDAGGMQVSGAGGSYDALRWDGSCVTLQSEEVTMSKAPAPKYPSIDFRYLDDDTQEALRKDDKVNKAWQSRRTECKGATSGDVSLKCVKADDNLTKTVVGFVRKAAAAFRSRKSCRNSRRHVVTLSRLGANDTARACNCVFGRRDGAWASRVFCCWRSSSAAGRTRLAATREKALAPQAVAAPESPRSSPLAARL